MDERTCPQCGVQNPPASVYCWQCYARFDDGYAPTIGPVRAGTIRPAQPSQTGAVLTAPAPPHLATTPPHRPMAGWVVKGVFFVLSFAGGWWAVDHFFFSGFPFPDQVAGQPRVESQAAEQVADALSQMGQALDVEMEFAFYGSEIDPAYVMFAFEVPDAGSLGGVPGLTGSDGSIPFQCSPDFQGSACIWEHEGMAVGLGGPGTPDQIEPVARQVRAELA